jgi:predicted RNase H-like HicB family nuclease
MTKPKTKLTVVTYSGIDGYVIAECPEIPGCISQGRTEREARENIRDAIRACLSVMIEDAVKRNSKLHPKIKGKKQIIRVEPPELEPVHA